MTDRSIPFDPRQPAGQPDRQSPGAVQDGVGSLGSGRLFALTTQRLRRVAELTATGCVHGQSRNVGGAEAGPRTHASDAERRIVRSAELPFCGTWWAVPGRLLVGPHPAAASGSTVAQRVDSLVRSGVRALVDLTQSHEEDQRGSCRRSIADLLDEAAARHGCVVRTLRASWMDQACPSRDALLRVQETIARTDGLVYVHCWNGIGRASLAAGVYLMEQEGVRPADCLREIAERRLTAGLDGIAPSSPGQRVLLERWE